PVGTSKRLYSSRRWISLRSNTAISARSPGLIAPRSWKPKCPASLPVMTWIASSIVTLPSSRQYLVSSRIFWPPPQNIWPGGGGAVAGPHLTGHGRGRIVCGTRAPFPRPLLLRPALGGRAEEGGDRHHVDGDCGIVGGRRGGKAGTAHRPRRRAIARPGIEIG